jgi:polysaccharide pyruvyl transferase WcaK-like protein
MPPKSKKVIILPSEGGYTNIGDEAMFLSFVNTIKSMIPGIEIIALTPDPDNTVRIPGVKYSYSIQPYLLKYKRRTWWKILSHLHIDGPISNILYILNSSLVIINALILVHIGKCFLINRNAKKFLCTILESNILVNSGGGNLNLLWEKQELFPRCITFIVANIFQKKIVITGQGIGPLKSWLTKKILAYSLNKSELITLRDFEYSENLLREIGVNAPRIESIGDDAIFLDSHLSEKVQNIISTNNFRQASIKIGVHFRLADYAGTDSRMIRIIIDLINQLIEIFAAKIVLIPMAYSESENDPAILSEIFQNLRNKKNAVLICDRLDPYETKEIIGQMDFAIGLSYHFIQFALSKNVPAIGIYKNEYYKQKLIGLLKFYGLNGYIINLNETDFRRIPKLLEELITKRNGIVENLKNETQNMKDRAIQTMEHIKKLVIT